MKNRWALSASILLAVLALTGIGFTGCKTPSLEAGGAYAPTNEVGVVVYNDLGLALADSSYRFAYETTLSVLKFEKDSRAMLYAISPNVCLEVKHALDGVRTQVWDIDQRWAAARKAYRAMPTPAGLTTLQKILAEITRLVLVAQTQLEPAYLTLETTAPATPTK